MSNIMGVLSTQNKFFNDLGRRRYVRKSFILNFDGVTDLDGAAVRTIRIRAPFPYQIIGCDLMCREASGNLTSVTLAGPTGFTPVTVLRNARTSVRQASTVFSSTNADFVLSLTTVGAMTLDRVYAVIHYVVDLWGFLVPGDILPLSTLTRLEAGQPVLAADINNMVALYGSTLSNFVSEYAKRVGISVYTYRNIPAAVPVTDRDFLYMPNNNSFTLHSFDVVGTGLAANSFTVTALDNAFASLGAGTAAGGGVGSIVRTTVTPGVNISAPVASLYRFRFSRVGAGAFAVGHAVVYFT